MVNVAVIGAGGGIGQPLSLLLKLGLPYGSTLTLFDVVGAAGVAADLSHIDRPVKVVYGAGKLPPIPNDPELKRVAKGVDVFVIVAGVPRKPGMTRDDLFNINAGIVLDIVKTCAAEAPNACYCIVTNPVNSTVPIAAQALKKLGVYNKDKLFGVSTLDVLRATQFINEARAPHGVDSVPVIGGHSDVTIVPLFSQVAGEYLPEDVMTKISKRVQVAGTEVVKAKAGRGSATLSMAAAGARFALWVVDGLTGKANHCVYSYVDTTGCGVDVPFLAMPIILGKTGIEKRLPIGKMNSYEAGLFEEAKKVVKENIAKGEKFAKSKL